MRSSTPGSPRPGGRLAGSSSRPGRLPLVMGILNVTPDSFFPGSRALDRAQALDRALRLRDEGADILDVGGQSTRPGSEGVSDELEAARVIPVIAELSPRLGIPLSIDTDKASVARRAREAGASILNDVTALSGDPGMAEEALAFDSVILMHMRGRPRTMQEDPRYRDVVGEVKSFLSERKEAFVAAGGDPKRVLVDPGIGFGKDQEHNLALVRRLREFSSVAPVVLGVSRKSFLGRIIAEPGGEVPGPEDRLEGSLAAACWAMMEGVRILRVHDVGATRRALATLAAIRGVV